MSDLVRAQDPARTVTSEEVRVLRNPTRELKAILMSWNVGERTLEAPKAAGHTICYFARMSDRLASDVVPATALAGISSPFVITTGQKPPSAPEAATADTSGAQAAQMQKRSSH